MRGTLAPSTGPTEGIRVANQVRVMLAAFPEVTDDDEPGRPPRRRDRHDRLLQHRVLRRSEAEGGVAPRLPPGQGAADRRDGPRAREDSRRDLELLAADRRQHGRGGQRREGRARDQDLRRRPEDARGQGRSDRRRHAHGARHPGPRAVPRARPAEPEHHGRSRRGRALPDQRLPTCRTRSRPRSAARR